LAPGGGYEWEVSGRVPSHRHRCGFRLKRVRSGWVHRGKPRSPPFFFFIFFFFGFSRHKQFFFAPWGRLGCGQVALDHGSGTPARIRPVGPPRRSPGGKLLPLPGRNWLTAEWRPTPPESKARPGAAPPRIWRCGDPPSEKPFPTSLFGAELTRRGAAHSGGAGTAGGEDPLQLQKRPVSPHSHFQSL